VAQMTDSVRDAVFGNVGTTISFRVSADDAPVLVKQFEPTFEAGDLLQLNNRHFVISMIINGEKVPAFSATTLSIPKSPTDNFDAIIEHSRKLFGRPRAEIEAEIRETIEQSEKYKKELSDSGREAGSVNPGKPKSTEQKPNLKYEFTPQADFRRQNLSPNTAEGKDRPGLKDLAKLVGATEKKESAPEAKKSAAEAKKPAEGEEQSKNETKKRNKQRGKKIAQKVAAAAAPVSTPVNSPVPDKTEKKEVLEQKSEPKKKNSDGYDGFFVVEH
ncbi:MAG: hypothetical protein Q4B29_01980, partial [Candidatus Saccharibacteria bacterium]|nr:hypothetical protein [Candidatus Saccharibacteria bacterium]